MILLWEKTAVKICTQSIGTDRLLESFCLVHAQDLLMVAVADHPGEAISSKPSSICADVHVCICPQFYHLSPLCATSLPPFFLSTSHEPLPPPPPPESLSPLSKPLLPSEQISCPLSEPLGTLRQGSMDDKRKRDHWVPDAGVSGPDNDRTIFPTTTTLFGHSLVLSIFQDQTTTT